jgi:hypothetical protein
MESFIVNSRPVSIKQMTCANFLFKTLFPIEKEITFINRRQNYACNKEAKCLDLQDQVRRNVCTLCEATFQNYGFVNRTHVI